MAHELEEALYIHNAGLVILAPFLPRYFKMLEMTEEKQFINDTMAVRGAQLLHYLVTGQTSTPEHLMVLNKIMCGVDLLTPVPAELELNELEIETSNQLLNAILQNWDKMSGSTVENLRGSFLIRDGMILEHSDSWALKVESKAYDIILSFLPWAISMISLPWMEKQLETEWNTSIN